jgi:biopolymer transport protein ExbD
MKHLALVMIAIVACKSDKPAPPAPTPTDLGSGSGSSAIAAGSGSGSAACVIKVTLTQTNVAWDGGGVKGQSDFKQGEKPHLDALNGLKCSAWLVADDKMLYQDVIAVMDALVQLGITDVALGNPKKPTDASSGSGSAAPTKPDLTGDLEDAPVLIITKTEVTFHGKLVGKPDDEALATKLAALLPKDPKDPTFIIQADKDTAAKTINRVVTAAGNQGYNVLFAVKNK